MTASVGLPSGRRIDITGQIDRIGVTDAAVHIADFKTGTPGAVTPRQALQLALYRAAGGGWTAPAAAAPPSALAATPVAAR